MHNIYETILSRFGSRFCLNLRPNNRDIYLSPFGTNMDVPSDLAIGLRYEGESRVLPFTDQFEVFENIDQSHNLTSVSFSCSSPKIPIDADFSFHTAFYPNNIKLSIAPFFYLDLTLTNSSENRVDLEVFVGRRNHSNQRVDALKLEEWVGLEVNDFSNSSFSAKLAIAALNSPNASPKFQFSRPKDTENFSQIVSSRTFQAGEKATIHLLIAAFIAQDVLEVDKKRYKFKYIDFFSNLYDVMKYAEFERFSIEIRNLIFNSTLLDLTLPNSLKNLTSYAFQSFSSNSWWVVNESGEEWFSLWNKDEAKHSLIHLERCAFLFYLFYWPDLAKMILDEWATLQRRGSIQAEQAEQAETFQVEPSCDFISMTYLYWCYTSDLDLVKRHFELTKDLVNQIINSDGDKDGFPDTASSCYVDEISQTGLVKPQTHLAIRILVALSFAKEIADILGEAQTSQLCEKIAENIRLTLQKKAWFKDHFAASMAESELYSPYNFNSLIYPLLCGKIINVDDNDNKRVRRDIIESYYQTMKKYGSTSNSLNQISVISQNLIRDIVAGYLGLDLTHNCENYWDYQIYLNKNKGGCYTDLYNYDTQSSDLSHDPHGIIALGLIYALGGIQIDKRERRLTFHPLKTPLRLPILSLALWDQGMIPWVEFRQEGKNIKTIISNEKCLDGFYTVETRTQ